MARSRLVALLATLVLLAAASVAVGLRSTAPVSAVRTVDARVVGEPYRPLKRGGATLQTRAQAASDMLQWQPRGDGVLSRWVYPALELGRALDVIESAQRQLERGPDYNVLVALSAAYAHGAAERGDIEMAARALDAASRAVLLTPDRPEAWFNRGVALEHLGLGQWSDPWQAYRRVDSASPWAGEAAQRAAQLAEPAALPLSGERLRTRIEHELVPAWATAVLHGDATAAEGQLRLARPFAAELQARYDEPLMQHFLHEVGRLAAAERHEYARAIDGMVRVRLALEAGEPTAACAGLADLRGLLARHATASRLLEAQVGACHYYLADYAEARRTLSALAEWAAAAGHDSLAGRSLLTLAAVDVRAAGAGSGDAEYVRARRALHAAGEISFLASASALWAQQLHEQGDAGTAWALLREAFEALPQLTNTLHVYTILVTATDLARTDGMDGLAWFLSADLQQAAERSALPALVGDALTERALLQASQGRHAEAAASLAEVRRQTQAIGDPEIRAVSEAILDETQARIAVAAAPCEASASLRRALDRIEGRMQQRRPTLFRDLADALERCGHRELARDAYRQGIAAFEAAVADQAIHERRISHTDALWDLYARLARLEAAHFGRPDEALLAVDAGRRAWLGRQSVSPSSGDLAGLQRRLGSSAVLTYLVLQRESFVWATTSAATVCIRIPVGAARLQALVDQWTAQVADGLPDRDVSHVLYTLLVAPVEHATGGGLTVVIPDGPLHGLAFGALWTGRAYLVERTAVWTAGSLADLSGRAPGPSGGGPPRALVVGNPALGGSADAVLPSLPTAEQEAMDVSRVYPGADLLVGTDATRAAVLEGFRHADIVHVAAHAVVNLTRPFDSRIPLAGPGEAALTVRDLLDLPASPRIIVLSSCQSAAGRASRGFGATSLARVLVQHSASAAVGALWDLDDAYAPMLATVLHQHLAGGVPVAEAVRRSQLAMLARGDEYSRTRVWAAMVGVGAPDATIVTPTARR